MDRLQRYLDEIDDYLGTVEALYAFAVSAAWDDGARRIRDGTRYCIPRRMEQAKTGRTVTPDAVVQVTDDYGVVAEAKKNFRPRNSATALRQLTAYDDSLVGWWTKDETIAAYDIVLLVHQFSSVYASDAFEQWTKEGARFGHSFAIVEFGMVKGGQLWLHLKRIAGSLSDRRHDNALRTGKKLGKDVLSRVIAKYKFTEASPPLIHMMHLLHDYVLPLYPREEDFESHSGAKKILVTATVDDLRDRLEEQFCDPPDNDPRRFRLPRREWVAKAMEEFRRIGLATRIKTRPATYQVRLRRPPRRNTIEYLAELIARADESTKKVDPAQGELFEEGRAAPGAEEE